MKSHKRQPQRQSQKRLVIAVISDVHAYDGIDPDKAPSHCCVTENNPTKNALAGLLAMLRADQLKADLLFCPGDIADKAQPVAVQHVWRELHVIKSVLGASDLITTTGNHDIDSRYAHNEYDAKGMLQALDPPYPFPDEEMNNRYWARHFVLISRSTYRILVLNSSAFHGEGMYDETKKYEFEQGRVSDNTLTLIRKELETNATSTVNVLLCHHHPHQHSELRLGSDDLMIGGHALLDLLGSGKYGRWLIVHGHKHHPKLECAAGGAEAPIVFAAGSLAAVFYRDLQTAARNQFYLVEFPIQHFAELGFVGRFRSWDWLTGQGWIRSPRGAKLPAEGGFGWRGDLGVLARQIAKAVNKPGVHWDSLVKQFHCLDYLMPQDLERLVQRLRDEHKLVVEPPDVGPPTLIGRAN
ncbi:MAG: hypothetical protein EXS05_23620 [Planctomycetaceae bacterium]|nr:hypothetical protein [Planctomycetaceae bacterium]